MTAASLTTRQPNAAVALAMLTTGGLAAYSPARRATRIDPVVALRNE